jgi:hypothetical protein
MTLRRPSLESHHLRLRARDHEQPAGRGAGGVAEANGCCAARGVRPREPGGPSRQELGGPPGTQGVPPGSHVGSGHPADRDDVKVSRMQPGPCHIAPAAGDRGPEPSVTPEPRMTAGMPGTATAAVSLGAWSVEPLGRAGGRVRGLGLARGRHRRAAGRPRVRAPVRVRLQDEPGHVLLQFDHIALLSAPTGAAGARAVPGRVTKAVRHEKTACGGPPGLRRPATRGGRLLGPTRSRRS